MYTSVSLPTHGKSCSIYTMGKSILLVCNQETADMVYLHAQNYFTRTLHWNRIPGKYLPWCHRGFDFSFCSLTTAPSSCPLPHQCTGVSSKRLYLLSNSPASDAHGKWGQYWWHIRPMQLLGRKRWKMKVLTLLPGWRCVLPDFPLTWTIMKWHPPKQGVLASTHVSSQSIHRVMLVAVCL